MPNSLIVLGKTAKVTNRRADDAKPRRWKRRIRVSAQGVGMRLVQDFGRGSRTNGCYGKRIDTALEPASGAGTGQPAITIDVTASMVSLTTIVIFRSPP